MPFGGDDKKKKAIYDAVSKDYDLGTYDDFSKKLDDPTKRQSFYNGISHEYDLGDYNTFNQKLGYDSKEVQQQSQQPSIPMADINQIQSIQIPHSTQSEGDAIYEQIDKRDKAIHNTIERQNELSNKPTDVNSTEYKQQFDNLIEQQKNNDRIIVEAKDGKPFLVPASGFFQNAGESFVQSIKAPINAVRQMMMDDKELQNYFDKRTERQPYLPKSMPSPIGNLGNVVGGIPKIAAELSIPYVDEALAVAETELSSTGQHAEELYHRRIDELADDKMKKLTSSGLSEEEAQKQINITDEEKQNAASQARKDAPLAALPDAAMILVLNRMGGNSTKLNTTAQTFTQTLQQYGNQIGKISLLGGVSESARSGIEALQGYNVTPEEAVKKFGEGAYTWGLMDAMFKVAPIISELPKAAQAQWKDYVSQVPKPIFEKVTSEMGDKGDQIKKEVEQYAEAKKIVHPEEETEIAETKTPQDVRTTTEEAPQEKQAEVIPAKTNEPVTTGNELEPTEKTQPATTELNQVGKGTSEPTEDKINEFEFDENGESKPLEIVGIPKEFAQVRVLKSKRGYTSAVELKHDSNFMGKPATITQSANIDFGKSGDAKYFDTPQEAFNYATKVIQEKYANEPKFITQLSQPTENITTLSSDKDNSVVGNENNSIEAEHNNAIEPVSEESTQSQKEQSPISENTEQVAPQEKNENIGDEQKTDGNTIGARHESLNNVADRLGLPPVERGTFLSPEEQLKRGRRLLEGGADPQQVANDFIESGKVSADEISVARAQQEKLAKAADEARKKFGKDSDEFKKAQQEYADWDRNVIKPMGTASGAAFSSLQGETDLDTGSFISVKKAVEDASGNPVNAKQEKKIEQLTNDNAELKKRAEEAEKKLIEATNENIGKGNKKTYTEKAKDVANRFRKLKQKPFTFKDENGNDITPQVSGLTWNDLVELGAKAIEKTGEIADGVAAILDKVKDADWYVKLSDKDKTAFEEKLNEHFGASLPITERFADKKDNKFSTEDAKDIWDYAKKNYLDKGTSYRDMIAHVRDDLGLSWRQVNEAISSPKTKPISDAMWKRQADYRKMQNATRNWIDEQNKSVAGKVLRKVSGAFRGIAVYGHGGIFVGTHAGMTLFQPSTWSKTIPAFFRGWKYAYGNEAVYEKAMEELKNRPTYTIAQRAGLKNNPDEINTEEYQKSQTFLGKIGDAGKKGFNAIKVLRQDLFDFHYDKLSATDKVNPEVAKSIAQLVNNATGATNLNVPDWINEATFAGAMEASRWGKLLTNPVKANVIAVKAILTPDKVSASDRVFAKVWARRVGEQVATYGSLLLANAAIQGMVNPKNPVNLLHPSQPNWLRFKFGDYTFDPTSGMVSVIDFISSLVSDSIKSKKERHGDTVLQADAKNTFGYLRGKLAPAYGTGVDLKTGTDFSGNTLPYNNDKPQAGRHQLTWLEYATEKLPIPVAESFKVMFQSAVDNGLSKPQASDIFKGIISGAVSGTTGFRVGESTPKPTPYTDQDKQDPIFKYYIDKGLELPNTSPSSEKITDEDNATKKLLSDYPKDIKDKYIQVHKDFLKEELQSIKSNDAVYVKKYKENGKIISEVSLDIPEKGNYQQVKFSKLSNDELVQILHLAQTAATKKTKEQLFPQAQETF